MKRVWNPPIPPQEGDTVTAWRSVGEKEGSTTFRNHLDKEFPNGDTLTEEEQKVSRRNFTKLMGASSALAGLGLVSCRRPESYIVPFKQAPEWVIPGKPLFYASTRPRVGGAVPLVVTTFEGRPTKLEPNPDHPDSSGTDALTQASVLDLYSPSRSQKVLKDGKVATLSELKTGLQSLNLESTALVFGADDCPSRNRLAKDLAAKGATLISYEPLTGEALDKGLSQIVDFSKATRILSLDCDFLGMDLIGNSRVFAAARQGGNANYDQEGDVDKDKMNRLYQVETQFSLTGGLADHRLRVAPSRVALIAEAIYKALTKQDSSVADAEKKAAFPGADNSGELFDSWIQECVTDLENAGPAALVLAGSRQTKEVKVFAAAINAKLKSAAIKTVKSDLGQYGSLDDLVAKLDAGSVRNVIFLTPANPVYDADGFASALEKAKVSIHWGLRNDATSWACDWHVPASHYLESWADARTESGILSLIQPMILPLYGGIAELELLHVLGGGDFAQGEFSPAMGEVKTTFAELTGKSDDKAWMEALMNGFSEGTAYEAASLEVPGPASIALPEAPSVEKLEVLFATDASVFDGRFIDNAWMQEAPDPITKQTWDNSAQVSPQTAKDLGIYDRIIKLETKFAEEAHTGENGSPGEGENARAPFVLVKVGDRELEIPVLIAFGQADNTVVIPLGYGQAADDGRSGAVAFDKKQPVVGHVGLNTGFNGYQLRSSKTPYSASGATLEPTKKYYKIALTQEHNSMYGRALAREISTNDLEGKGSYRDQLANVAKQGMDSHAPPNISLYKPEGGIWSKGPKGKDGKSLAQKTHLADEIHQWGMSIDLNTCTGCNACLVACQAENSIPVVGKDQVAMGREMHWIRMDRYFASQEYTYKGGHKEKDKNGNKLTNPAWVTQNPESIPQPVACVQCEMAPCETVCPVNATVHTEEGLNAMAYNRCIGTRYCANNCPYKARRFNFFDYNKRNPLIKGNLYKGPFGEKKVGDAPHLQRNPNVSVRMRGVMEKCTYCVQRLESAKIKQKQQQKHNTLASGLKSPAVAVDRIKDLRVKTDSVKTACQEACPMSAISFGNLLDLKSKVVAAKGNGLDSIKIIMGDDYVEKEGSKRNYDLLNYINTRPRTSYLARVKNPNDKMPDAKFLGQATINLH